MNAFHCSLFARQICTVVACNYSQGGGSARAEGWLMEKALSQRALPRLLWWRASTAADEAEFRERLRARGAGGQGRQGALGRVRTKTAMGGNRCEATGRRAAAGGGRKGNERTEVNSTHGQREAPQNLLTRGAGKPQASAVTTRFLCCTHAATRRWLSTRGYH